MAVLLLSSVAFHHLGDCLSHIPHYSPLEVLPGSLQLLKNSLQVPTIGSLHSLCPLSAVIFFQTQLLPYQSDFRSLYGGIPGPPWALSY